MYEEKILKSEFNYVFNLVFYRQLAKIALKSYNYMFFASSLLDGCSRAWLWRFAKQRSFFASFMNGDCTQAMQQKMAVMLAVNMSVNMSVSLACPQLSPALSQDEEKDASIDAKDATSSSKVATLDEKAASLEPKDTKVKKKA